MQWSDVSCLPNQLYHPRMAQPPENGSFPSPGSGITVTPYPQEQPDDICTAIPTNSTQPATTATSNLSPSKKRGNKKKKSRNRPKSAISSDSHVLPSPKVASKPPRRPSPLLDPMTDEELSKLSHSVRIRRWFCLMKLEERQQIVSIIDPSLSDLLLSMDQKLTKEGQGLFYEVGESSSLEAMMLGHRSVNAASGRGRSSSLSTSSVATNQRMQSLRAASNRNKSNSASTAAGRGGKKAGAAGQRHDRFGALKFFDDFFMGREVRCW